MPQGPGLTPLLSPLNAILKFLKKKFKTQCLVNYILILNFLLHKVIHWPWKHTGEFKKTVREMSSKLFVTLFTISTYKQTLVAKMSVYELKKCRLVFVGNTIDHIYLYMYKFLPISMKPIDRNDKETNNFGFGT